MGGEDFLHLISLSLVGVDESKLMQGRARLEADLFVSMLQGRGVAVAALLLLLRADDVTAFTIGIHSRPNFCGPVSALSNTPVGFDAGPAGGAGSRSSRSSSSSSSLGSSIGGSMFSRLADGGHRPWRSSRSFQGRIIRRPALLSLRGSAVEDTFAGRGGKSLGMALSDAAKLVTFRLMVAASIAILEVTDALLKVGFFALKLFAAIARAAKGHAVEYEGGGAAEEGAGAGAAKKKKPTVVVVGASFAGLACTRALRRDFDVVLVDRRRYFEYTPGVLRLLVQPSYFGSLFARVDKANKGVTFVQASCTSVLEDRLVVQGVEGSEREGERWEIPFEYAVVGSGSVYGILKPDAAEGQPAQRFKKWQREAERLRDAASIAVVGGGPVGVELAAEVAVRYPQKRIALVDSSTSLCSPFAHEKSSSYVEGWLRKRGVEVILGEKCEPGGQGGGLTLSNGKRVEADEVYKCVGMRPDTGLLENGPYAASRDVRGYAIVEDSLQLKGGSGRVFCLGDAMTIEGSSHTRLGHTAEVQAKVVASNIERLDKGLAMCRYPKQTDAGESNMYCISLGPTDASMRFGDAVVNGFFAAFVKWSVEWSKVAQAQDRLVGLLLWKMSDYVTSVTVDKDSQPLLPASGHGTE